MSVKVVVTLQAAHGNEGEVLSVLRQGKDVALAQDGCEGFEVLQGKDESNRFMLIEHWASVEKHRPHFQKNVMESGVLDRINALIAGDPQWGYYENR